MNLFDIFIVTAIILTYSHIGKAQYEHGDKLNNTLQWSYIKLKSQDEISNYIETQTNFMGDYLTSMANCGIKFGYEHPNADYEKMSTGLVWLLRAYAIYLTLPLAIPTLAAGIILVDKGRNFLNDPHR